MENIHLTPAEEQITELVAQGLTDKEIADRIGVNFRTVNFHLANIRQKTKCRNKVELLLWAIREGRVQVA